MCIQYDANTVPLSISVYLYLPSLDDLSLEIRSCIGGVHFERPNDILRERRE